MLAVFDHPETPDSDQRQRLRGEDAEHLLPRRTNRLLRWYRAASRRTEVIELTRAQASPFRFEAAGAATAAVWNGFLMFEAGGPTPLPANVEELTEAIRSGLSSGDEPRVVLYLIDADRALHDGRFREAVLFSWSTIDAVFNAKYDLLVGGAAGWRAIRN